MSASPPRGRLRPRQPAASTSSSSKTDGSPSKSAFPRKSCHADPAAPVRWLTERGPFDLVAGPSGYGLPLVRARDCTDRDLALMTLVRPDERGRGQGVVGFGDLLRALCASDLPVVFLPGVIHLPTVPAHRKINRIDLGTPDKLCVAALALAAHATDIEQVRACVVELGSAFTACVVIDGGRVVDGLGGTSGPCGWGSGGAWDGELAYLLSPLAKRDLFAGGASSVPDAAAGPALVSGGACEGGRRTAGRHAVRRDRAVGAAAAKRNRRWRTRSRWTWPAWVESRDLHSLPGAWVKHAAQGAAVIADGLAGGRYAAAGRAPAAA